MKRLALLLAAMGIVSVGAMAEAPKLEVTSVGQEIEIENQNGGASLDEVNFFQNVGLKYGDWTFGLQAGKQYSIDFDGDGMDSKNSRLQLDVWKKVTPDLKLGARYRGYKEKDRWYARWDYSGSENMYWSAGDVWYEATQNDNAGGKYDWVKAEVFPIGVKFDNFKVGYFLNYEFAVGSLSDKEQDEYIEHQIRAYWDFYKTERLTLSFEGRFTLAADLGYKGEEDQYRHYDNFGRIRTYLGASYKVTESLTVYGKYAYEWRDYEYENGDSRENYGKYTAGKQSAENYQDIIVGWNYKF